jgi:hypothetical protein
LGVATLLAEIQGLEAEAREIDRMNFLPLVELLLGLAQAGKHLDAIASMAGWVVPHFGHAQPILSHVEPVVRRRWRRVYGHPVHLEGANIPPLVLAEEAGWVVIRRLAHGELLVGGYLDGLTNIPGAYMFNA